MHRLTTLGVAALFLASLSATVACGPKKQAEDPAKDTTSTDTNGDDDGGGGGKPTEAAGDGGAPEKKDECVGFDIGNLEDILGKVACEEEGVNPETLQPVEMKGKLEVTVSASPTRIPQGSKGDLLVNFVNKSKEPLTLHFRINPVPYFSVEVYDAKKNKRADMPAGNPPPPPKGMSQPPASDMKSAKVTLAPGGAAHQRIPFDAQKTKWAPEKVRGTPAERGYPRTPAGPLPKGKYNVRVLTPLVGVQEGSDHEVSGPKVELEITGS